MYNFSFQDHNGFCILFAYLFYAMPYHLQLKSTTTSTEKNTQETPKLDLTPEEIEKLQLLKMIVKCQKSKKHKPKKVRQTKLKIGGEVDSYTFPETLLGIHYNSKSLGVRQTLRKIANGSK